LNWDKTIGLDFVQEEDLFGSLEEYDPIIDKVLARHPHLDYKKVYHAGETKDHRTHNLEVAVKAGSVRIGHGFNILQRIEFLPHCKNVCFEKNPLSNLVLGYNTDAREASAPILLGLGYAVTINPDDPGKFGVEDSTVDYFLSAISYNWTLRHLKLVAYHSINHAICDEHTRASALRTFEANWERWIREFLQGEHGHATHQWVEPDIYSNARNWSWSEREEQARAKF
jgi:adenosine deaminase